MPHASSVALARLCLSSSFSFDPAVRSAQDPAVGPRAAGALSIMQRTYDIARNQGSTTTRNANNSRTKRLLGKSHTQVFRN
jgi:hypothetical protein